MNILNNKQTKLKLNEDEKLNKELADETADEGNCESKEDDEANADCSLHELMNIKP